MASYYPPVAFNYQVVFGDIATTSNDNAFQSVSGLNVSIETENLKEGGENRFEHKVPVRTKFEDIVLKRGVLRDSGVINWIMRAIVDFDIQPITIDIKLLNEEQQPLIIWNCVHVWPKKWSISDLNAEKSEALIETIELNCNFFRVNYDIKKDSNVPGPPASRVFGGR